MTNCHPVRCTLGIVAFLALGACAGGTPAPIRSLSVSVPQNKVAALAARPRFYVVRPNDTLSGIGQRFSLSYADIAAWNGIADPGSIRPGQILRLEPGRVSSGVSVKSPVPRLTPAPGNSQQEPAAIGVEVKPLILSGAPTGQDIARPEPKSAPISPDVPPPTVQAPVTATPREAAPSLSMSEGTPMSSDWLWPAEGRLLTRFDPGPGMRHGIDIGGRAGAPVRAARAGTVLYSGSGLRGYGRLIIIRHDKKFITAYAHNAQLLVSEGARVKAGQVIARMGQSGNAGRVMLHFELREQGRPKDPLAYLPPRP